MRRPYFDYPDFGSSLDRIREEDVHRRAADPQFDEDGQVRLAPGFRALRSLIVRRLRRLAIEALARLIWSRGLSLWLRRYTPIAIRRQDLAGLTNDQLAGMLLAVRDNQEVPRA